MTPRGDFEDGRNPCPCPQPVIALLALAVRYLEAGGASEEQVLGATYIKTFMEQPAEEWCAYVEAR